MHSIHIHTHVKWTHIYKLTVFLALSSDDSSFFGLVLLMTCTVQIHASGIPTKHNQLCTNSIHANTYSHRTHIETTDTRTHSPSSQIRAWKWCPRSREPTRKRAVHSTYTNMQTAIHSTGHYCISYCLHNVHQRVAMQR